MSLRGASAAVQTEIAASANAPVHLFELYLAGATTYATDASISISWNGNTYPALGTLIGFDGLEETATLEVTQARVTLAGIDQTMIAALLQYAYLDRRLVIRKAFLNAGNTVIVDPIAIFDGRCDAPVVAENPDDGTCSVTIAAAAQWIDFERSPGRHTNHEEQQIHFPGDLGFEYVSQLNKDLKWGKK